MNTTGAPGVRVILQKVVPLLAIVVIAFSLKLHYSKATAGELQWILSPTAAAVGLLNGRSFTFEAGAGYCDYTHRTVIAPVCAGVNFMIVAFCMMAVLGIRRTGRWKQYLPVICLSLAVAGGATIVINAVRITIGIFCYDSCLHTGWLSPEQVHRLAGIAVYFFALCGIYAGVNRCLQRYCGTTATGWLPMAGPWFSGILIPAFWYLAMTVALPLLLGKYSRYGHHLVEHAVSVLFIPGTVLVVALLLRSRCSPAHKTL